MIDYTVLSVLSTTLFCGGLLLIVFEYLQPGQRIRLFRALFPVIIPVVSAIVLTVVYIRLSCVDSIVSQCGNVSELSYQPPQSAFSQFMNLWSFGGGG
jgi:hypothetical protein